MTTFLIVVHISACVLLILVVLLQAGRGADMGAAFGGASTPMFGSGSASNPLARATTFTAVAFLASALFLAVASAKRASVFDSAPEPLAATPQAESSMPLTPPPAAPIAEAQPLTIPAAPQASSDANATGEAATEVPAQQDVAPAAQAQPATEAAPAAAESAPAAEAAPAETAPPPAPPAAESAPAQAPSGN